MKSTNNTKPEKGKYNHVKKEEGIGKKQPTGTKGESQKQKNFLRFVCWFEERDETVALHARGGGKKR